MKSDDEFEREMAVWEEVYDRTCDVLEIFGVEGISDDYWVHEDYWGYPQVKVYANELKILAPPVVSALQAMIAEFPSGWEIVVAVSHREIGESWPNMGLRIRAQEIVDGLDRSCFPAEYRNISYERARRWTEADD